MNDVTLTEGSEQRQTFLGATQVIESHVFSERSGAVPCPMYKGLQVDPVTVGDDVREMDVRGLGERGRTCHLRPPQPNHFT